MVPNKHSRGWLSSIAYVAALHFLLRLFAFLLEVQSTPFSLRDGGKVFAGWLLLLMVCCLAIEAFLSVWRRWLGPPAPPVAADPYLLAVAELQKERQGEAP
jgi:hypothetical protein